jgi:hypothetical protein
MRAMIRINAPIMPPTTAGMSMEGLLLELTWPGSPVSEDVGVMVREVRIGDSDDVVEGESDSVVEGESDGVVEGESDGVVERESDEDVEDETDDT